MESRLVALDLLIARSKTVSKQQKKDLKKVKSYDGAAAETEKLLAANRKALEKLKAERKAIISKLLKTQDAAAKIKTIS